jgi:CheY-like chemotaxis protein
MKLLVVEDDARVRRMIKLVLADLAEAIFECSDGLEAQTSYNRHRPDWVLMDITMTGVDGITATRQIKAEHPDARIIIVTAHESATLREAARRAGARDYVLKENLLVLRQLLKAGA